MNKIPIDELNNFASYVRELGKEISTSSNIKKKSHEIQKKKADKNTNTQLNDEYDLEIYEFLEDLEILAYIAGYSAANEMLDTELEPNADELEKSIYTTIDGFDFRDRLRQHINDGNYSGIITLANTEAERNYNNAVLEAGIKGGAKFKTWHTMSDDKVRDTHSYLEGMTVGINEDFYTFDNDHAPYPGGFSSIENNANCRCFIDLKK